MTSMFPAWRSPGAAEREVRDPGPFSPGRGRPCRYSDRRVSSWLVCGGRREVSFVFEGFNESEVDEAVLSGLRRSLLEIAGTKGELSVLKSVQVVLAGNFDQSVADRLGARPYSSG